MTTLTTSIRWSLTTALFVCGRTLSAQAVPVTPMPVTAPPPAQSAPAASNAPPADAVALCRDGTFVVAPRPSTDCVPRGGVQVLMPPRPIPPPRPVAAPAVAPNASAVVMMTPAAAAARAAPPDAPPGGATMRCKDGTWLSGAPSAARCDSREGVAVILPQPTFAPPVPARRP